MSKFILYLESLKAPNDKLKIGDTLQSIKSKAHYIVYELTKDTVKIKNADSPSIKHSIDRSKLWNDYV